MRKLTALVAGMTLAMTALPAAAGVVITQKQHVSSGANSRDTEQTISVQGDKQKMVTQKRTMIIDLGKGMMFVLDPSGQDLLPDGVSAQGRDGEHDGGEPRRGDELQEGGHHARYRGLQVH